MLTKEDVLEYATTLGTAVRIAIFPPWKISDVERHAAVNLGAIAVLTVLYLILRQFTPEGSYGLGASTVVTVFAFIFLVLSGLIINFFDPTEDATKLSNRWATFLIVSFIYSLVMLILVYVVPPLLSGGSVNCIDRLIQTLQSEVLAYIVLSLVAAGISVGLLYLRARMWFRELLVMRPAFLAGSLAFCVAVVAMSLFVLVFEV